MVCAALVFFQVSEMLQGITDICLTVETSAKACNVMRSKLDFSEGHHMSSGPSTPGERKEKTQNLLKATQSKTTNFLPSRTCTYTRGHKTESPTETNFHMVVEFSACSTCFVPFAGSVTDKTLCALSPLRGGMVHHSWAKGDLRRRGFSKA